jgi:hypothetical protein
MFENSANRVLIISGERMAHNVCVCAVVPYRSRGLSRMNKLYKINTVQDCSSRHHCTNILLCAVFLWSDLLSEVDEKVANFHFHTHYEVIDI